MSDSRQNLGQGRSKHCRRDLELAEKIRERVRHEPQGKFTLDDAAHEAGLSSSRTHQVFEAVQGESFGAYVRRVRLEYACGLMRAYPRWTCTRVAQEAGFSESSEFSRSFKREYGIAPSRWNRILPLNRLQSTQETGADENFDTDEMPGFPLDGPGESAPVSIRSRQAQRLLVLAVPDATNPDNLALAFDRLEEFLVSHEQIRPDRRFSGLSHDSDLDTKADLIRYELAYPVDQAIVGEADFLVRELKPVQTAVLPCRGGVEEFIAAWDYLLRGFLPASRWGMGPGPHMEIYYNDPRKFRMTYWDMDCVIPIL